MTVIYTTTHTSHTLEFSECKHLPLPKSVTTRVKTLLARGVQMEKVMDGMLIFGIYKCVKFLTEVRGNLGSCVNRDDFKENATLLLGKTAGI